MNELCDAEEIARRLKVTKRTVLKLAKRGTIPVVKIHAYLWRFHWPDVVAALAKTEADDTPEERRG